MEGVTEETGNTVQGQTKPEPKSGGIRQKLNRSKVKKNLFLQLIMFRVTPTWRLMAQARTSYLPNEILWGHHFENHATVAYDKKVWFC